MTIHNRGNQKKKRSYPEFPKVRITHHDEPVVGSLGRKIALRVYFPDRDSWWKAFNAVSSVLGEVAPRERDDTMFYNDRWFSTVSEIPRYKDKWALCVFTEADADLIMPLINAHRPAS